MNKILLFAFTFLLSYNLIAQTNISGVVNAYSPVSAISGTDITVGAQSGTAHTFVCGDRVMLVQMKGATISTANNATFGNITSIGDAGNYEMATVESVSGSVITLSETLTNSYTVSGLVQLVYVPHYEDATVTSTLTALAWNGTVGGVLALEVDGNLTLNADIDVSEQGFRGGAKNPGGTVGDNCTYLWLDINGCVGTEYLYASGSNQAVEKGEGVALFNNTYLKGRGKNANGGGGGGLEAGGGGGGSNFGTGGIGGACNFKSCGSFSSCECLNNGQDVAGLGGLSLTASNKLFLGGGGGAASNGNSLTHYNTPNGNGMKGGGVILISANNIIANGNNISSNGENGVISSTIGTMGTGGGGGGGSIQISASEYSNLIINANGGRGNDSRKTSASANNTGGSGGGGGGGRVVFNSSTTPSGVTVNTLAGAGGLCYDREGDLRAAPYSAAAGSAGTTIFNEDINMTTYEPLSLVNTTTSIAYVVSANRVETFSNNGMMLTLGSNNNDLGNTTITTTVGSNGPFTSTGCTEDELYISRIFDVVPTNQPTSPVDVSLYITKTEFDNFVTLTNAQSTAYQTCWGVVNTTADLIVTAIHTGSVETITPTFTLIGCNNDIYQVDFQVSEFSTFYLHSKGGIDGNVLPVEMLSFNAESIEEGYVDIDWTTVSEINNEGFMLERSLDGIDFEEIEWINGMGDATGKSEYFYQDDVSSLSFEKGATIYYRLKQIDFDGAFEYSKTIAVKRIQSFIVGNLFPNPTGKNSEINITSSSNVSCKLEVLSVLGEKVYTDKIQLENGFNQVTINSQDFKQGVYVCYFYIDGNKFVKRLVKK